MANKKRRKVFVYGSLMAGGFAHHLLENCKFLGEAQTLPEYTMLDLGSFPGIVDGGETSVVGELYLVDRDTEKKLDALEGVVRDDPGAGLYRREYTELEDGQRTLIYIFNQDWLTREPTERDIVPSGDWREYHLNG